MLTPFTRTDAVAGEIRKLVGTREPTPIVDITADFGTRAVRIRLKREGANRWGSIKERTALGLITSVADKLTRPGAVLVESTSGNLGLALAHIAHQLGVPFVAVVDPNLSPILARGIVELGGELEVVTEADPRGGYLSARLARVAQLRRSMRRVVWTDQYHNPANPLAHLRGTGPEIAEQTGGQIDAVFVAVSTGGTLAGIGRYLHRFHPHVKVVAVDVPGSRVFGEPRGRRLLTGIGAGIVSSFLKPSDYDDVVIVDDAVAVAHCRALAAGTGTRVGGSSGAVLAACLSYLTAHPEIEAPLCVCPDDGDAYAETLYDDAWLAVNGVTIRPDLLRPAPELPTVRLHLGGWPGERTAIPIRCRPLTRSDPVVFMEVEQ
jgi:N-(2-amino-2-carboxyethyl)-L-glutamate synthase